LTTKKQGGGPGPHDGARPRIKSSHERVLDAGDRKTQPKPKPKTKVTRGASRAAAPRSTLPRPSTPRPVPSERGRNLRKARPTGDPQETDRDGAWSVATESARDTATAIAVAALDKKAVGVEVLDVAGRVDYADFLVIMTGRSDRHAQALAQGIEEALKKKGVRPVAVEGLSHGAWVLMDYGDVVVHVFQDEARQLYDLDGLWLDARRLSVPKDGVPTSQPE